MTIVVSPVLLGNESPLDTCFGLACPLRSTCLRYLAIDYAPGGSTEQVTCCLNGIYPDYVYALSPEVNIDHPWQLFSCPPRTA